MQFGQDLMTRNMFRSVETGIKGYSELAKCYDVEGVDEVSLLPCKCCCVMTRTLKLRVHLSPA